MSNAVAKTETQLPMAQVPTQEPAQFLNSDVVIPKLLLMQGLSELVNERKAMQGDMIRSTTGEKLGDDKTPVEFIPLTLRNEWVLKEKIGNKFEYRGTEPRTPKNEDLPWAFTQNGAEWSRMKVINCFALLPQDIAAESAEIAKFKETGEMPDLNKTLLPVVIAFRSTSFHAGKAVATHFAKAANMAKFGVKPHGFSLKLKCYPDKNDKGSFYVFDIEQGGKVAVDAFARAEEWYHILNTRAVQVDNSDEAPEASGSMEGAEY